MSPGGGGLSEQVLELCEVGIPSGGVKSLTMLVRDELIEALGEMLFQSVGGTDQVNARHGHLIPDDEMAGSDLMVDLTQSFPSERKDFGWLGKVNREPESEDAFAMLELEFFSFVVGLVGKVDGEENADPGAGDRGEVPGGLFIECFPTILEGNALNE